MFNLTKQSHNNASEFNRSLKTFGEGIYGSYSWVAEAFLALYMQTYVTRNLNN